jgi:hypothetical protein
VLVAAGVTASGQAAPAPKVFDRTFVCTTGDGGPKFSGKPDTPGDPDSGFMLRERTFTGGTSEILDVGSRYVVIDKAYCKRSANRVALTRRGLPGPPMAIGGVKCPAGRVLIRVRYTYVPGPHPDLAEVGGQLISASLAARSYRTLKPLAYATLTAKGRKLQLYSAASYLVA